MTYTGPERRDIEPIAVTIAFAVARELRPVVERVDRLTRLIEGENGGMLNEGVVGAIKDLQHTDAKLEARVIGVERKWDRLRWTVGGWALGGGVGAGSLVAWLTGGGP